MLLARYGRLSSIFTLAVTVYIIGTLIDPRTEHTDFSDGLRVMGAVFISLSLSYLAVGELLQALKARHASRAFAMARMMTATKGMSSSPSGFRPNISSGGVSLSKSASPSPPFRAAKIQPEEGGVQMKAMGQAAASVKSLNPIVSNPIDATAASTKLDDTTTGRGTTTKNLLEYVAIVASYVISTVSHSTI